MGEYTTNKGLYKPARNERAWGKRVNDNWDILDDMGGVYPVTTPVDGDFSWVNQEGATKTVTNGRIHVASPASSGDNLRCRVKTMPSTPYVLTIGIIPSMWYYDYHVTGLIARDSSSGRLQSVQIVHNGNWKLSSDNWTDADTNNGGAGGINPILGTLPSPIYFRLDDNGTNFHFQVSEDGYHFRTIIDGGRTSWLATPDQIGWMVQSNNATYPVGATLFSWLEE